MIRPGKGTYEQKVRIARQVHTCCECGDTINKGVSYQFIKGKWASNWATYSTCTECAALRDYIDNIHADRVDDEPGMGELYLFIRKQQIPIDKDKQYGVGVSFPGFKAALLLTPQIC